MRIRCVLALVVILAAGCGEGANRNSMRRLGVQFFGLELGTFKNLTNAWIALQKVPPVSECPGDLSIGRSSTLPRWVAELKASIRPVGEEPGLPSMVDYSLGRDRQGRLSVSVSLAEGGETTAYLTKDLRAQEGECGVFLLPTAEGAEYAVCFVVTSAPLVESGGDPAQED